MYYIILVGKVQHKVNTCDQRVENSSQGEKVG